MKAYIYCRISCDKGGSSNDQYEDCLSYCVEQNWKVAGVYPQIESSRNMKNMKFIEEIINSMDEGDILIVHSVDRFSRNVHKALDVLSKMEKRNLKIYSVTEKIGYNTTAEKFSFRSLLNLAEWETDKISDRIKRSMFRASTFKGNKKNRISIVVDPNNFMSFPTQDIEIINDVDDDEYNVNNMNKLRKNASAVNYGYFDEELDSNKSKSDSEEFISISTKTNLSNSNEENNNFPPCKNTRGQKRKRELNNTQAQSHKRKKNANYFIEKSVEKYFSIEK